MLVLLMGLVDNQLKRHNLRFWLQATNINSCTANTIWTLVLRAPAETPSPRGALRWGVCGRERPVEADSSQPLSFLQLRSHKRGERPLRRDVAGFGPQLIYFAPFLFLRCSAS